MNYEIYSKDGKKLALNEVDEYLCKQLNIEISAEDYCFPFNDLVFIGSLSIEKDARGFTTPEKVAEWAKESAYSLQTTALVSYLLTYKYDIKSWK